jgi:hypothetical protein
MMLEGKAPIQMANFSQVGSSSPIIQERIIYREGENK